MASMETLLRNTHILFDSKEPTGKRCVDGVHTVSNKSQRRGKPDFLIYSKNPKCHDEVIYLKSIDISFLRKHWPKQYLKLSDDEKSEALFIIKALGHYVVRIQSAVVSHDRPSKLMDGRPYWLADRAGGEFQHAGSGWIRGVYLPKEDQENQSKTQLPKNFIRKKEKRTWKIWIETARHVLYDSNESQMCQFTFFESGTGAERACHLENLGAEDRPRFRLIEEEDIAATTLTGGEVWDPDTEADYCRIKIETENETLGEQLSNFCEFWHRFELKERLIQLLGPQCDHCKDWNAKDRIDCEYTENHDPAQCLIIGNTLGNAKTVAVRKYYYNDPRSNHKGVMQRAETCNGNCGGLVVPVAQF